MISPNFFETMEIPVVLGRGFTARDNETAPKVVVINEAAAKKYFPNEDPVGQQFGSSIETTNQLEIVGVLRDAKYNSVRDPAPADDVRAVPAGAGGQRASSKCGPPAIRRA